MRNYFLVYPALLLVISMAGCQKQDAPSAAVVGTKVTIAQSGQVFLYLPLYIAKTKGFFAERGLDVNFLSTGGEDNSFAALTAGSAQFAVVNPVAVTRGKGPAMKVITSLVCAAPYWGLAYRRDIGEIDEAQEFSGLRIATQPSPGIDFLLMKETLSQAGLLEKSQMLPVVSDQLQSYLKDGQADLMLASEPLAAYAVKQGAHIVYSATRRYGDFAFAGIVTTDEKIAADPKLVQALVLSVAKAIAWIHADFEDALQIAHAEFPQIPVDILRDALHHLIDNKVIPNSAVLRESAWNNAVQLYRSTGEIKADASYAGNVATAFAQRAP